MSNWESLFDAAMACLDSVGHFRVPAPDWSFGGGTALMLQCHHRVSKDIDIFLRDAQYITLFSPRLNDATADMAKNYEEMSNFVKLMLPQGEIDFIVAPLLTSNPCRKISLRGRDVDIETPEEIVTKKAFYRAADFQVRDIFDMAVVLQQYPGTLWDQRRILFSKLDTLDGRLAHMHAPYAEHAVRLIQVLPDGVRYLPNAYEVVTDFVKKLKADRGG